VKRIAEAGRLRVSETRALHLIHSAGCGMTLTLIALAPSERDPAMSVLARESVIAAVTTDPPTHSDTGKRPVSSAVALRAALPHAEVLTRAERALMADWLDRIAAAESAVA
jgi:hypothetical protein